MQKTYAKEAGMPQRGELKNRKTDPGKNLDLQRPYFSHARTLREMQRDPVRLSDPRAVSERTDEYLTTCEEEGVKPTLPGLAMALGTTVPEMTSKPSREVVRSAMAIENATVQMMEDGRMTAPVGIFLLKNWFGYKDQNELHISGNSAEATKEELEVKYANVELVEDGRRKGKGR